MGIKVTLRQRRAVEALLTSGDVAAAAAAAAVSRKTVYRWLKQPAFRAELENAEAEALQALQRRLVALGARAGDVLEAAMESGERTADRLRAADITLARLLQLRELVDWDARLSALEAQLAGKER